MYSVVAEWHLCYQSINEIESLVVEPCFTSFQPVFGVSTSVAHRPDLNLEKQNQLPGPNSVCEVEERFVCEADSGEVEATSEYRKANPTQSVKLSALGWPVLPV